MSGPTRRLMGQLRQNIQQVIDKSPPITITFATDDLREAHLVELRRYEQKLDDYYDQCFKLLFKLIAFAVKRRKRGEHTRIGD